MGRQRGLVKTEMIPFKANPPHSDSLLHIFRLYLEFKLEPNYPITCVTFSDKYADRAECLVLVRFLSH